MWTDGGVTGVQAQQPTASRERGRRLPISARDMHKPETCRSFLLDLKSHLIPLPNVHQMSGKGPQASVPLGCCVLVKLGAHVCIIIV
jgi:hypothetical protein